MARFDFKLVVLSSLCLTAHSAPAPLPNPVAQGQVHDYATYKSDFAAFPTASPTTIPFTGSSGSLRGSEALNGYNPSNPIKDESTVIPPSDFELAPGQSEEASLGLFLDFDGVENFQPIRGSTSNPTDPGPRTEAYERLNSDLYAPPPTDMGALPNAKWPLGLSHNRHGSTATAGWARQQNVNDLPSATAMAGVDFRLSPFAYRELHWHQANEWAFMIAGAVRIASVNDEGESFIDDLVAGDLWFFPSGIPHSIQAKEEGCEFLLIFDDGTFSESGTDLTSELFERMPKEVLAKNFRTDVSSFDKLPSGQLYVFDGTPINDDIDSQRMVGPAGQIPKNRSYSYHFSQQEPFTVPGGSVKIVDSASFEIASNFAAALVTLEPGAMREIHWHTTSDEWNYFLKGQARLTSYLAPQDSQTFDFSAGDVGYIPVPNGHYIENTGNETCVFLEMLLAPRFTDISVNQWLGLTPRQIVKDTLNLPDSVLDNLPKVKPYIIPGNGYNTTQTNFTGNPI